MLCITWAAKLRALRRLPLHSLRHHCFCFSYRRLPHSVSRSASRPHGVPQSVVTFSSLSMRSLQTPSISFCTLFRIRDSAIAIAPSEEPGSSCTILTSSQTPPSGAVSASQSVSPHALPRTCIRLRRAEAKQVTALYTAFSTDPFMLSSNNCVASA